MKNENSEFQKTPPDEPLAVAALRFTLAAAVLIGGASGAHALGCDGNTGAAWVVIFATIGGLGGLYPGEPSPD